MPRAPTQNGRKSGSLHPRGAWMTIRSAAITTPTPDATIPNTSRLRRSPVPMLAMRAEGYTFIGVLDAVVDYPSLAPRSQAGQAPLLQRRPRPTRTWRAPSHAVLLRSSRTWSRFPAFSRAAPAGPSWGGHERQRSRRATLRPKNRLTPHRPRGHAAGANARGVCGMEWDFRRVASRAGG